MEGTTGALVDVYGSHVVLGGDGSAQMSLRYVTANLMTRNIPAWRNRITLLNFCSRFATITFGTKCRFHEKSGFSVP